MNNKDILKIDDKRKKEMLEMSSKDFVDENTKILAAFRQELRKLDKEIKEKGTEEKEEFKKFLENSSNVCEKIIDSLDKNLIKNI